MELTRANEDYLKAVWHETEHGLGATTMSISRRLQLAPSTVSEGIKKLTKIGLLTHDPYGSISLTPSGNQLAIEVIRRHRIVETYLCQELEYPWDQVHDEAEELEHVVSDRLVDAMEKKLGYPERDPHGDPIPRADGTILIENGVPLSTLEKGQKARILRIYSEDTELLNYLSSTNLIPAHTLEVENINRAAGWLEVKVGEKTVALGLMAAEKVEVSLI